MKSYTFSNGKVLLFDDQKGWIESEEWTDGQVRAEKEKAAMWKTRALYLKNFVPCDRKLAPLKATGHWGSYQREALLKEMGEWEEGGSDE